jgi:hypothetical protein
VAVLAVLLMSMILVPPMLGVNSSGMRTTQIREDDALALHAADSGMEDALFKLTRHLQSDEPQTSYSLASGFNYCDIDVTIDDLGDTTYRITSTSAGLGGLPTTVESYVQFSDYSFLTDYALVTNGSLSTQPGTRVEGDARYQYSGPTPDPNIKGDIDGEVTTDRPVGNWPDIQEMIDFYWADVEGLAAHTGYQINHPPVQQYDEFGPMLLDNGGDLVALTSKKDKSGQLQGTVYVKGDLRIDLKQGSEIDLNECTIFVEGNVQMQPGTPMRGQGCIIATGDILFMPKMLNTEAILVLSLGGTVDVQPDGNFYGTIAAAEGINIQPGGEIVYPEVHAQNLHLPGMGEETREVRAILTYTIK